MANEYLDKTGLQIYHNKVKQELTGVKSQLEEKAYKSFVTLEEYGAVGDGVTNDTNALKQALKDSKVIKLLPKIYLIEENIELEEGQEISGEFSNISSKTKLMFKNGCGLIIPKRYSALKNLMLRGDGTGVAIRLNGEDTHKCMFENLIIENFMTAFDCDTILWDNIFYNMRINSCSIGFKASETRSSMLSTFINIYFNNVKQMLIGYGMKAKFSSCNFGICASNTILTGNVSDIIFENCNFECDKIIDDTRSIFSLSSRNLKFSNCSFKIRANLTVHVFDIFSSLESLIFENCSYKNIGGTIPDENFFNPKFFKMSRYGALEFNGSCSTLPRPIGISGDGDCYWIDNQKNTPITTYNQVDKAKLNIGQFIYVKKNSKLGYYDGSNIIDFTGAIIL